MGEHEVIEQDKSKFIDSLTVHLSKLSRKMLKIDTREEVLKYITDSFLNVFNCDVVAIGIIEGDQLVMNSSGEESSKLDVLFPFPAKDINPLLLEGSMTKENDLLAHDSVLRNYFDDNNFSTWFTMPISDEDIAHGLVIVGYQEDTILYDEMRSHFDELGEYVAIVLDLINRNKHKRKSMFDMHLIANQKDHDTTVDELVSIVTGFSGRESQSNSAAIYLFNEEKNSLIMQPATYGYVKKDSIIELTEDNLLNTYFPNVERVGHHSITVPLTVDMELIGVLYAEKDSEHIYTGYDLDQLEIFGNYFSVNYENMQLINKEKEQKKALENMLKVQQEMMKFTIKSDGFTEMNEKLGELLNSSIILYDRFFNVIDFYLHDDDVFSKQEVKEAGMYARKNRTLKQVTFDFVINEDYIFDGMPISDGKEIHAYIGIALPDNFDMELLALTINMIKNVYSLQFTKQKIAINAQEQIKGSFVERLLYKSIEDVQDILEYANLFNWDLYMPHRISILRISLPEYSAQNIIEEKAKTNKHIDLMRVLITNYNSKVITAVIEDQLVIFTPVTKEISKNYWENQYNYLKRSIEENGYAIDFVIGIGGIAEIPSQYYENYQKAQQVTNILLKSEFEQPYAFFDQMGSYTILNWVKENPASELFVNNYLKKLYELSDNQQVDLFDTLKVFLANNGNVSATASELYIHRSSLNYRLEKIQGILDLELDNFDERFNLVLAYKLYELHGNDIFK